MASGDFFNPIGKWQREIEAIDAILCQVCLCVLSVSASVSSVSASVRIQFKLIPIELGVMEAGQMDGWMDGWKSMAIRRHDLNVDVSLGKDFGPRKKKKKKKKKMMKNVAVNFNWSKVGFGSDKIIAEDDRDPITFSRPEGNGKRFFFFIFFIFFFIFFFFFFFLDVSVLFLVSGHWMGLIGGFFRVGRGTKK